MTTNCENFHSALELEIVGMWSFPPEDVLMF